MEEALLLIRWPSLGLAVRARPCLRENPALCRQIAAALPLAHDFTVCCLDFLEFVLTGRIIGVEVRVILLAFLAVRLFDGLLVGALRNAQYAVWIKHVDTLPSCACRAVL